jgi:hypothetical protein
LVIDFGYSLRPGGQMENGVPIKCAVPLLRSVVTR